MASKQATRKIVELYYDVISPYTWFAFETLIRYKNVWNLDLKLKPFFLAGVTTIQGNKAPWIVPAKFAYISKDVLRSSKYFGVKINLVENVHELFFEKGSLQPMRFLTAVNMNYPEKLENSSRSLWTKLWVQGEDIMTPENLTIAGRNANLTPEEISTCLSKMNEQEVKDRLKAVTQEAVDEGGFGSPTIVVHTETGKEMVFGSDRFPIIADLLSVRWIGPHPGSAGGKL